MHLHERPETFKDGHAEGKAAWSPEVIKFKSLCPKLLQSRFPACLCLWRNRYGHNPPQWPLNHKMTRNRKAHAIISQPAHTGGHVDTLSTGSGCF